MLKVNYKYSREYFAKLETRYYSYIAVPMVLMIFSSLKKSGEHTFVQVPEEQPMRYYGSGIVFVLLLIFFLVRYGRQIKSIRKEPVLRNQLDLYANAVLRLNLIIQLVTVVVVVLFTYTSIGFFGLLYLVPVVILSAYRPNVHGAIKALRLSKRKREILTDQIEIE